MDINSLIMPIGNQVKLNTSDARHIESSGQMKGPAISDERSFGNVIAQAFDMVSNGQKEVDALIEQTITNPDEVEIHEVTSAMARSEMNLRLTKAIVDRAIKAYNDITMLR